MARHSEIVSTLDYCKGVTFPFVSARSESRVSAGLLRASSSDQASRSDMRP
jgi:hypothetical protein